jgi:hypothetical protein
MVSIMPFSRFIHILVQRLDQEVSSAPVTLRLVAPYVANPLVKVTRPSSMPASASTLTIPQDRGGKVGGVRDWLQADSFEFMGYLS